MFLPKAKTDNIVVQSAGDQTLIYDLKTDKAYCLNETSGIVYGACDGKTSFDDLRKEFNLTDDLIHFALDELYPLGLLDAGYRPKFASIPRRSLLKKIGLASAVALPVILSVSAPKAIHAQSCVNPGGAPAGTVVRTSITNTSDVTSDNQNLAGANLRSQCCSNAYRDFISNGCSSGIGETCVAQATCL